MANHLFLFGKPLGKPRELPDLEVTGTLPGYKVGIEYEGKLSILNSVGRCKVDIVESDLPPGAYAVVDQIAKKVVVRWPAYQPPTIEETSIVNGDFNTGDLSGWQPTSKWQVAKYDTTGVGLTGWEWDNARAINNYPDHATEYPLGNKAAFYTAPDSIGSLVSISYPVSYGQTITAKSTWDQGPSNKRNNSEYTVLRFSDDNGNPRGSEVLGNVIHDLTNTQLHTSSVSAAVPFGATKMTVILRVERRRYARPVVVDNVKVSGLSYSVGNLDPDKVFSVTLRVTDSLNRVALWSGEIHPYSAEWDGSWDVFTIGPGIYSTEAPSVPCWIPPAGLYFSRGGDYVSGTKKQVLASSNLSSWSYYGGTASQGYSAFRQFAYMENVDRIVSSNGWFPIYSGNGGTTWTDAGSSYWYPKNFLYVPAHGAAYCSGGAGVDTLFRTTTGLSWTSVSAGAAGNSAYAASPAGQMVHLRGNTDFRYSADGVSWSISASSYPFSSSRPAVCWAGDRFIAGGQPLPAVARAWESADGVVWVPSPGAPIGGSGAVVAYVPELGEVVMICGTVDYWVWAVWRHVPGSGVWTQAHTFTATNRTPVDMIYDEHSKQLLLVMAGTTANPSNNFYVSKIQY